MYSIGMERLTIAAIVVLLILVAAAAAASCGLREGYTPGVFAGAGPSIVGFLPGAGAHPVLESGYVEAYASTRSQNPCGRIDITPGGAVALTPERARLLERELERECGRRPGWFVAQARYPFRAAEPKEGFYWAQWGNVASERENFSPDAPGACDPSRRSVAARLEADALRVADGR